MPHSRMLSGSALPRIKARPFRFPLDTGIRIAATTVRTMERLGSERHGACAHVWARSGESILAVTANPAREMTASEIGLTKGVYIDV